jgi:hypothetical protein
LQNSVEGKLDNISDVQATEYKKETAEGHLSVVEVIALQGVTVKFQRCCEGSYIIQKLVNSASFELQGGKDKFRGHFNLRHLKPYLENGIEKYKSKDILEWIKRRGRQDVLEGSATVQAEAEDLRRVNNIEDPATLGNCMKKSTFPGTVTRLVMKFQALYGTRRFIAMLTTPSQ